MAASGKSTDIGLNHQWKTMPFGKTVGLPGIKKHPALCMRNRVFGKNFPGLFFGATTFSNIQAVVAATAIHKLFTDPLVYQLLGGFHSNMSHDDSRDQGP